METVQVALRIRPLVKSEIDSGCRSCIERIPDMPQVSIGRGNQMFTFNHVFDENEGQKKVYDVAVKDLIENLFKGYNLTILAYGQTGSGKTHTMGTNYMGNTELGIIPRAVYNIFDNIESKSDYSFNVSCSFIELYNESLYDLLTRRPREESVVDMRENNNVICIPGLTEVEVSSPNEALNWLLEGSQGRVVGATAMNATSSRSHAIFTINIRISNKKNPKDVMRSKFHLVDLAGSERSKKTGATGDRFKEGVNINKGLMVLGNVISQLCEGNHSYINYRDSKLTRLLQDSLGGNSVTLMIACVSPADYNLDESVSTLRYADRAKKIKNRPIVNQDPQAAEISRLKKELEDMRLRLIDGGELKMECPPSHKLLADELSSAESKIKELVHTLTEYMAQNSNLLERAAMVEKLDETMKTKWEELNGLLRSVEADADKENNMEILSKIKEKISEVQAQKLQCEQELLSHEKEDSKERFVDDGNTALGEEHILSQARMNKEIYEISKTLIWKEELMAKLQENTNGFGELEGTRKKEVEELKHQVELLQTEKNELLSQINSGASNSHKVSEQRRKRLQELEQQKAALMKKIAEQANIIKMKQNSDEKIKLLRTEITEMKLLKVKLIQQMKKENEKFRSFKIEKDREMCQLRSQNIRKQNQLKKLEQQHSLQQNVLKRKLEAAAAANKRIMAVLEKQKEARLKRTKGSALERIKEKMQEEMELLESEVQAQRSLDSLVQDRTSLSRELNSIKESLNDENVSAEDKKKLQSDMIIVQEEIANRSTEIADIQQKLMDIHQEDRSLNWAMVQTMADAKFAIDFAMGLLAEKIKEHGNTTNQLAELKEQKHEFDLQIDELTSKLENVENLWKRKYDKLEKESEEKISIMLRVLQDSSNDINCTKYEEIKCEELEKLANLRSKVSELEAENERLNKMIISCKPPETHLEAFTNFLKQTDSTFVVEEAPKKKKRTKNDFNFQLADEDRLKEFDDSFVEPDDPKEDPDWSKTPIFKRLQSLKGKKTKRSKTENCSCLEDCTKLTCSCQKDGLNCSENCSCESPDCKAEASINAALSPTKRRKVAPSPFLDKPKKRNYFS